MAGLNLEFKELSPRAQEAIDNFMQDQTEVNKRLTSFEDVKPRDRDTDGSTETIDGVTFTHHVVSAPGDYDTVHWHYVTCGKSDSKPVVFLHGIPDSWFQWCHQMSGLASDYFCIAIDLKGYGQSEKGAGDYRHEGVSEQLFNLLQQIGVEKFFLATHDRGTVQGDFLVANHPDNVLGYARGEQHLYHFNPKLAPQGEIFKDAAYNHIMDDPKRFVVMAYVWMNRLPVADEEVARAVQEFWYPEIARAVPRYFNSSTFRQEWAERRRRLLAAWKCPVVIMQGWDSRTQPREFYEGVEEYIPNAKEVLVKYIPGGHFWTLESPQEALEGIKTMISLAEKQ